MVADFFRGFSYFIAGLKLAREPKLFRYVWVPLLSNIVLFLLLLIFAGYGLNHFSQWVQQFLPHWLQWLHWLIWVLSLLFISIVLIFLSTIIVNIIAGPFNGILSEKVIAHLNLPDHSNSVPLLVALPAAVGRQLRFLGYYLPRAVFYLILFIIPVIQIIAFILWFLFNGWVFTMQYLDYPMDNHGISIRKMRGLMAKKAAVCVGFGCGVVLFTMIPVVNFIVVPVAVVGATLLWVNEFRT